MMVVVIEMNVTFSYGFIGQSNIVLGCRRLGRPKSVGAPSLFVNEDDDSILVELLHLFAMILMMM